MTPEERAAGESTVDLGEWQAPLDEPITSPWAIVIIGAVFFGMTMGLLLSIALWKGLL